MLGTFVMARLSTKRQTTTTCMVLFAVGLTIFPRVYAAGPIAATITKSGLSVAIQDFVQMPATGSAPRARINFLREQPGGADRLFVNDLNGFLYTLDKSTQAVSTYIDFTSTFPNLKTSPGLASGLVTFAFHPEFATNGKFYTVHSETVSGATETPVIVPPLGNVGQHSVLLEWTANSPAASTFSGTRREVMRVGTVGRFHPMGDLGFNPLAGSSDADYGMLYVSIGDGQSYNLNQAGNLQRLDSLLGTILRIDPDPNGQAVTSVNGRYSIPASNPWASDGNASTFGEIYTYGHRNSHRMTWDSVTGEMFATELGENDVEEINLIKPGRNYGWSEREGTFLVGGGPLPPGDTGYTYPVAQYDQDEGRAISSGFVYRGSGIPSLEGKFVFGDIVKGRIFYSDVDEMIAADDGIAATTATIHELQLVQNAVDIDLIDIVADAVGQSVGRVDLRLAADADGELYIMTKQDGFIRQLISRSGDYDYDLDVDADDLAVWQNNFGTTHFDGDADGDEDVDGHDFLTWQRHLDSGQLAAVIPEPQSLVMVIMGMVALLLRRQDGIRHDIEKGSLR